MKGFPFRRRIAIWSTLLAAIVLLVSGVCAAFVLYHRACAQLREEMEAESAHFFAQMHERGTANFPWSTIGAALREWMPPENTPRLIEVTTADGTLRYRSKELDAPGFGKRPPGVVNVSLRDQTVMLVTSVQDGVTFSIGSDLSETSDLMFGLAVSLVAALPVALLIAWLGGRWLAVRAVEPVVKITDAAESVTAQRLDRRVPVPAEKDEIQRLATVLNTTLDRLATSYAQAIRFSADASHELKTPLAVLRTSIEALLDSASLAPADRAAVAGLLEQTQRLSRITSSLLLLARADAGQLILDVEEHDLSALTAGCAEDARIMAEGRSLAFECQLPSSAPARVDAMRYSQIVSNLLVNAVKYNRAGGMIRLALTESGGQWRLRVANTGHGIPPLVQDRLFERFFRAEHHAEEQGQGLGLSLARELACAHGGDIVLVASDSHWTEFLLTLPKAGPGPSPPASLAVPISNPNLEPNTTMKAPASLVLTLLATAFLPATLLAGDAPKIKGMAHVPAPAAAALVKYAEDAGMKIEEVSTEKHGKVTVYEASLTAAGKPAHEVAVTADGKVKGEEETVPLDTVPEAARKAITDGAKGAKIGRVQKIKEDGLVTYEALYVSEKGKKTEVEYLEDGKVKPEEK